MKIIGNNIEKYRSYPRIVGETGGKDFIVAHPSAEPLAVATGISRGAFEFQGQKCSAASRIYLPSSLANEIIDHVKKDVTSFKMGSPEDMGNFITAVIHEGSFNKLASWGSYISAISSLFFFYVVFEAFSSNRKVTKSYI